MEDRGAEFSSHSQSIDRSLCSEEDGLVEIRQLRIWGMDFLEFILGIEFIILKQKGARKSSQ